MKTLRYIGIFIGVIMLMIITLTTFAVLFYPIGWYQLIVIPGWNIFCILSGLVCAIMVIDDVVMEN